MMCISNVCLMDSLLYFNTVLFKTCFTTLSLYELFIDLSRGLQRIVTDHVWLYILHNTQRIGQVD